MKNELLELLNSTKEEYDRCCEASRNDVMRGLKPYEQAPVTGKLHTDAARARVEETARTARQKAVELLNGEIEKAQLAIAAAPSTDALNTVSLLSITKSKDVRDYEAAYKAYGSNPQVANALGKIARDNDVNFFVSAPEYDRLEDLQLFRKTVEKALDPFNVANGKLSSGYIAAIGMDMENAGIE